ncbi:sulfotransferase family protein [Ruegeria faecimaris]|uniref:sulfotransferase family protein n=1 Tax=Ruegeria faecimaris TaxID=686389 RepID=UPI00232EC9B4|nr:sulfotransferase [Ruegeria faecimaris]
MGLANERKIDFLIFGAAKCATTWLQNSLTATPQIFMPDPELHYFSDHYDRGAVWYRDQYEGYAGQSIVGEKCNTYLTHPEAAKRIAQDHPDVRLILQMRDPVRRAYSDYCMLYRRGTVGDDIHRYLDPDKAGDERFLHNGRYAYHLRRFYDLFPTDQILLLAYENTISQPVETLRRVAEHIGFSGVVEPPLEERVKNKNTPIVPLPLRRVLAPLRPLLDPIRHTGPLKAIRKAVARQVEYPELPDVLAHKMADFYRPDVAELDAIDPGLSRGWRSFSD